MLPVIGDDGLEFPEEIKESLGDLAGDIYAASVYDDQVHGDYLARKFKELSDYLPSEDKNGFQANYMTYQAYKAASLFVQAVAKCRSSEPFIIASRIKHSSNGSWDSLNGKHLQFDSHGDMIASEFLLKKYYDGQFKIYNKEAE